MAKKYREVRRALRTAGWSIVRISGSHEWWKHPDGRVTVVAGGGKDNRDVPAATLASIRRQSGLEDLR
ncbi:MAG: type II toxin-antitoxin system HicA family toxin [Solirubrobacteraceae bacterium]